MDSKNKKNIFFLFILTIFLLTILSVSAFPKTHNNLNGALIEYGVQFRKAKFFIIRKSFKSPFREKIYHSIIAQEKTTRIEIEIITPLSKETALEYSESRYKIIKNLYGPQLISYAGAITKETDCPDDKKPEEIIIEIMGNPARVLLANATERYVLGVCDNDLIKQKAAFAVFFDKELNTFYQILIFQPSKSFRRNEVINILESLKKIRI